MVWKKIGFKLIFAVGLTTVIIIGVYSYFNLFSQTEVLLSEVERNAIQHSETVKNSTRYGMLLNQREHIHEIINTIGAQPSIWEVRVFNKVGEIIYSSNAAEIGKMVDKKAESCYACHTQDQPLERLTIKERTRIFRPHPDSSRILGVINPIYTEQSCWDAACHAHPKEQSVLGVLDITLYLTYVDEQLMLSEIKVIFFAVAAIISLSFIIGIFVKKWVDKPVTELVNATKHVANGNLNYTIGNINKDELGDLQKSFNMMTKKLSEARQQLFQSDRMASLGRLAAGVAHEINNPLTGILTYSSFLLKRVKNDSELENDLNVIVRETKRSREIVKSLLDFARQSVPKKKPANVNDIINRAINVVENQLTLNQVKIDKNLDTKLPDITVDENQMQQVFINLLVNASDAIGKNGGTIKIISSLISLSPFGIAVIRNATCPKNHILSDTEFKISGIPSIKLKASSNNNTGFIYVDPIYGKSRNHYALPFSKNKIVEIQCPECDISLVDERDKCPDCGAPIYVLNTPSQGQIKGCTKFGCYWQKWDFIDQGGEQKYVEINIKDTGCGISDENIEKIFEPFFSTKGMGGTGLGLAVIWGIVDNHGGTINVTSKIGNGTNFRIRLPIEQFR